MMVSAKPGRMHVLRVPDNTPHQLSSRLGHSTPNRKCNREKATLNVIAVIDEAILPPLPCDRGRKMRVDETTNGTLLYVLRVPDYTPHQLSSRLGHSTPNSLLYMIHVLAILIS